MAGIMELLANYRLTTSKRSKAVFLESPKLAYGFALVPGRTSREGCSRTKLFERRAMQQLYPPLLPSTPIVYMFI